MAPLCGARGDAVRVACLPSIGTPNPELGPDIERLNSVDWVIGARNFNVHWAIPAQQLCASRRFWCFWQSWVTCLHQSAESFWPVRSLDFGQRALARARTCWPG